MKYIFHLFNSIMISTMYKTNNGFIAVTAMVLLATGTLVFVLITMTNVAAYANSIMLREIRIQSRLDHEACYKTIELMVHRDPFLKGHVYVRDFNCKAHIENDYSGNVTINLY